MTEHGAVPEDDVQMTFFEHIGDLRKRLFRAVAGMLPAVVLCWVYSDKLLLLLLEPLREPLRKALVVAGEAGKAGDLVATNGKLPITLLSPADAIVVYMQIALIGGMILSTPWIAYQVWAFIAPGLYRKEKLMAVPFVAGATACFMGGALYCYYVVLPLGYEALLGFAGPVAGGDFYLKPDFTLENVLGFATHMLLAMGFVFEVPVAVTLLAVSGVFDWKQLLSFGRWWTVIAAVLSAVLTPDTSWVSQLAMLVPLVGLYYLSVGIAYFIGRKKPN